MISIMSGLGDSTAQPITEILDIERFQLFRSCIRVGGYYCFPEAIQGAIDSDPL